MRILGCLSDAFLLVLLAAELNDAFEEIIGKSCSILMDDNATLVMAIISSRFCFGVDDLTRLHKTFII